MSDSLRDQLMKAGFKENPASKKNTARKKPDPQSHKGSDKRTHKGQASKNSGGYSADRTSAAARKQQADKKQHAREAALKAEEAARIAEKKAIKQQIKTLIETDCIKDHTGTVAYSYQLGTRVKQLFVKEEHQKKLAAGELLITRLNGSTFLIPPETGAEIIALNPEWAMVGGDYQAAGVVEEDGDYAEYQIPDDLTW